MPDSRSKKPAYWEPDKKWLLDHKNSIRAIQAVWLGSANEGQQKLAMTFILESLCNRMGNQFYQNERETTFALGKKFVGDHIVGAINAKIGQIEDSNNARSSNSR